MRSTTEALQAFQKSVDRYIDELNQFSMEQLLAKPSEEEWSIGQMYVHLIRSAQYLHLRNVDQCIAGNEAVSEGTGKKTENGKKAFELGSFPPIRIRVPASPQYTPNQPESKEQLIAGLQDVAERMKHTEPALIQAPLEHTVPHPNFGALNAAEWFLLVEMHYRHHFLQLERLKAIGA
ncbi:DinB superfamily protein [Paenibacillus catalpae]|uniref:DinB superfamily protein n=1 Tax=Paenibacillus catalpae TaxID=1045775 RepID=A0A1I2E2Z2_9BACL|nr:DinB family protein [Paenibacillus catalpae]SFE87254.1 DinB superfamily protein [Paenibacillus catalpae]